MILNEHNTSIFQFEFFFEISNSRTQMIQNAQINAKSGFLIT